MAVKRFNDATGKHEKRQAEQPELALLDPMAPLVDPIAYTEPCRICNAKVGEVCASIVNASHTRAIPHAARLFAARSKQP